MVARILEQTASRVDASAAPLIVVSGDDTTALATVAGLQRRGIAPGVLWLSARGGFHTAHTTPAGDLSGMALAMLTGRAGRALADAVGLRPLAEDACALVGARGLDDAERDALAASRIRRLDLAALADGPLPDPPWYVHLDVDLLDPGEVPPLRAPVPGGPSTATVAGAVRALAKRGSIAAFGLACTFTAQALAQDDTLARVAALIAALA